MEEMGKKKEKNTCLLGMRGSQTKKKKQKKTQYKFEKTDKKSMYMQPHDQLLGSFILVPSPSSPDVKYRCAFNTNTEWNDEESMCLAT